jgi:hypothetical protein
MMPLCGIFGPQRGERGCDVHGRCADVSADFEHGARA